MTDILNTLPELQLAEKKLRAAATARGVSYVIADYGGLRSQADTTKILQYRLQDYAAAVRANPDTSKIPMTKWRPVAPFGSSYHNYGAAFDVLVTAHPAGENGYSILGALAPDAGLRWGGSQSFIDVGRVDIPHFELPVSLTSARIMWLGPVAGTAETGRIIGGVIAANPVQTLAVVLGILLVAAAVRRAL
jgi:hypothetical protein